MKKIWLLFLWFFVFFTSVSYGYDLDVKDRDIVVTTTNKIEKFIEKKWEDSRAMFVEQITLFQNKHQDNARAQALLDSLIKNIKTSQNVEIQNKILSELENTWLPNLKYIYSTWAIQNMPLLLNKLLDQKRAAFNDLIQNPTNKITFSLVEDFNEDDDLSYLFSLLYNYNSVNANDEIRQVIEDFQPKYLDFGNEISFSKPLYEIYMVIKSDPNLTTDQKRIVDMSIKAFDLNWISLSQEKTDRLKEITKELSSLSLDFWNNLLDSQKEFSYYIDKIDTIKDMPEDVLAWAHKDAMEQGKDWYLFSYNNADYLISYCSDENVRKEIRIVYDTFASSWKYDNRPIILKILKLRKEMAQILWFKNYWEYSLSTKMAPSPEFVMKQEDEILSKARNKADKEVDEVKEYFNLTGLNIWDLSYYSRKLKEQKYQFDDNALRDYFEFNNVKKWLFDIANKLYWLEFKEIESQMYDQDVKSYEVYKDWKLIWYYILDAFYNPNKSSWAWANILRYKKILLSGERLPIAINVLSIQKWEENTLLTNYEVIMLFHEFWHVIHALSSESQYPALNWFNVERDFVELPSQLMENWAQWESLKLFAYNYKTWEVISDDLLDKMDKLKNFMNWVSTITQIMYSRIDMLLHTQDVPETVEELDQRSYKIFNDISYFKNYKENKMYANFSHIFDWWYSAWYYSYIWAQIIESDIFSVFKKNWLFDQKTADKFYEDILSQWSRKPALELFKDFMWRTISLDWFYQKNWF